MRLPIAFWSRPTSTNTTLALHAPMVSPTFIARPMGSTSGTSSASKPLGGSTTTTPSRSMDSSFNWKHPVEVHSHLQADPSPFDDGSMAHCTSSGTMRNSPSNFLPRNLVANPVCHNHRLHPIRGDTTRLAKLATPKPDGARLAPPSHAHNGAPLGERSPNPPPVHLHPASQFTILHHPDISIEFKHLTFLMSYYKKNFWMP